MHIIQKYTQSIQRRVLVITFNKFIIILIKFDSSVRKYLYLYKNAQSTSKYKNRLTPFIRFCSSVDRIEKKLYRNIRVLNAFKNYKKNA